MIIATHVILYTPFPHVIVDSCSTSVVSIRLPRRHGWSNCNYILFTTNCAKYARWRNSISIHCSGILTNGGMKDKMDDVVWRGACIDLPSRAEWNSQSSSWLPRHMGFLNWSSKSFGGTSELYQEMTRASHHNSTTGGKERVKRQSWRWKLKT